MNSIQIYRCMNTKSLPVVSFTANGESSSVTADMLSQNGFYLRGGLHWSLFCHLFLLFLYSSVRLPLETLLWHESIRGMSAIRI